MSEDKKAAPSKPDSKNGSSEAKSTAKEGSESSFESSTKSKGNPVAQNGKGSGPRNIFSEEFRRNFDAIDWSK